jgi:hypothetical protein
MRAPLTSRYDKSRLIDARNGLIDVEAYVKEILAERRPSRDLEVALATVADLARNVRIATDYDE